MPWQKTRNKYPPRAYQTQVGIHFDNVSKFKDVFGNKSIYSFFVKKKVVYGKYLILFVQSMRINEFLDMLDDLEIPWEMMDHIKF